MKNTPRYVAFSTQKGGAGKSTFTILTASWFHYVEGYNVAVIDCDFPQHSIKGMRMRDSDHVSKSDYFNKLAYEQFSQLQKGSYPVLTCKPKDAIATAEHLLRSQPTKLDLILFDLPGTMNTLGVIDTLTSMDYIFTPITASRQALESSLRFATAMNEIIIKNPEKRVKALHLFWNWVDGREKTEIYTVFENVILELGLSILDTHIPSSIRYRRELSKERDTVFLSTLFLLAKRLCRAVTCKN